MLQEEDDERLPKLLAGGPVSLSNEEASLGAMEILLMERLDKFGNRTSEMLSRLGSSIEGKASDHRLALALNFIMVEKYILDGALESIEALKGSVGGDFAFC